MSELLVTLREGFAPPTEAWWFGYAAGGCTALLVGFHLVGLVARRFAAPVLRGERSVAGAHWAVRGAVAGLVPLVALGVIGAVVVLSFSPRRAVLVSASSGALPHDDGAVRGRVPEHLRHLPLVSADPLIDEALARAADEGAARWVEAGPTERARLRAICSELLTGYARGERPAPRPRPRVPRHIEDTVAMTLVQGALRVENAAACVVAAGRTPAGRGWNRAPGALNPARTPLIVTAAPAPAGPVVALLFDGRSADGNKRVGFQVIFDGAPGGPAQVQVEFRVTDPDSGRTAIVRRTVSNVPTQRLVVSDEVVSGFPEAARLIVTAEGDTVRTPLVAGGAAGPVRVNLAGPGADIVKQRAEAILGTPGAPSATRGNLSARGLALPEWSAPGDPRAPSVEVLSGGRGVLVLAPGLSSAGIPAAVTDGRLPAAPVPDPLYGAAPALMTAGTPYAVRVSETIDGPPTMDSLMSADVPAGELPKTAPGVAPAVRGFWFDTPLAEGRFRKGAAAERPVVEGGVIDGKPFVFVRLDPGADLGAGDGRPVPSRVRGFVTALVWAVNAVLAGPGEGPADARDAARGPEPAPLLTADELDELTARGRRPADAVALAAVGAYLGVTAVYLLVFLNRR